MKQLFVLFSIVAFASCGKETRPSEKTGKALFFTDVFHAANCKIDSVSIYIDGIYRGKLLQSSLPTNSSPDHQQNAVLSTELAVGQHSYSAKIAGCTNATWMGKFKIEESSTQKINLSYSTSKN